MKSLRDCSRKNAVEEEIHNSSLRGLYDDMCRDLRACRDTLNFPQLWAKIAPAGNVYRFNALMQERLLHCEDLGKQMDGLAEEFKELLGGDAKPLPQRRQELVQALRNTRVEQTGDANPKSLEQGETRAGFPPLEEFVEDRAVRGWFTLYPEDEVALRTWRRCEKFGLIIFVVQVFGPICMFCDKWSEKTNYLRDPRALLQRLRLEEMLCLRQRGLDDWSTICMGVLFMVLVLTQLRHYAEDECGNVTKASRMLPHTRWWTILGSCANGWCVISSAIQLPILFWALQDATSVLVGALGLLFIFALDDFSGVTGTILGVDDARFQRAICWHVALLSQCPVTVRDLINAEAKTVDDLWHIGFDAKGLLKVGAPGAGSNARTYCETRIAPLASTETTPLKATDVCGRTRSLLESITAQDGMVQYATSSKGSRQVLAGGSSLQMLWQILVWFLKVLQVIMPPLWMLINKPCPHLAAPTTSRIG
jgi:hypothetical protein